VLLAGVVFLSGCATVPHTPSLIVAQGPYHIITKGQTLYSITKVYGVDVKELMRINNIIDPGRIEIGEKIIIPKPTPTYIPPQYSANAEYIKRLVGEKHYRIPWRTITLHHSATREGNAASFDRNHRHRGMGGLFYHFVIGNGEGFKDGGVEVGWRWRKQVEANRPRDIQICLVGDFSCQEVSPAQFSATVTLIKALQQQYGIPLSGIRTHRSIHAKPTECPGKNFPFARVLSAVRQN
jgi:LysM repeat protein